MTSKTWNFRLTVIFALALAFTAGAWGQSIASAQLSGIVTDPKGGVVANAKVTLVGKAKNFERSTVTDTEGQYQFLLVPPGVYTLTVEGAGFAKFSATDLALTVGQTADLPVALKISASETVEVNAQTVLVETTRTSSTNTVQQQRIDNLPINGRNYVNFTLTDSQATRDTAPSIGAAPTSGISFSGQRARSNLVNVDGMDAVDNSVNGIRSTVSQEAVQEFQIIENGYSPEYGRASGGVVNIITRSGSNALHGTIFGFLRDTALQATNRFSTVQSPSYTRVQAGVAVGGPIIKDKMFWYFAYEGTHRQETGFSTIGANNFSLVNTDISRFFGQPAGTFFAGLTPQQAALAAGAPVNAGTTGYFGTLGTVSNLALNGVRPAYAAFLGFPGTPNSFVTGAPLPGSYISLNSLRGNFPIKEATNIYSLRLDYTLNNRQSLMLSGHFSPSFTTGIQVNAQNQSFGQNSFSRTSTQNFHDMNVTAQHTWQLGNNKVNEARFQYARRGLRYDFSNMGDTAGDSNTVPDGQQVAVNITGVVNFGREPFSFVNRVEERYQVADSFSWTHGAHNMKFGVDYNHLPLSADFTVNFGALYNFGSLSAGAVNPGFAAFPALSPVQAYGLGVPQSFVQGIGNPHDSFSNNTLGLYAQDSWRLRPGLTLNYGVRYDVEFTPSFNAINPLSAAAERALGIIQGIPQDSNNFAPRVGVAWDPWNDGKTVVRASYGIFYDHPLLALAFDSDVADGSQAPQLILFGGAPSAACSLTGSNLNATNTFQGIFNPTCFPGGGANFGYLPQEQRFNPNLPNSVFVNQNYLANGVPLVLQPFGFPVARNFVYGYSQQVNLGVEHDMGNDFSLSIAYNFNGGRHLNRPINANPPRSDLIVGNWENAMADPAIPAAAKAAFSTNPLLVNVCGINPQGHIYVPAAVVSFFRPSGINPSLYPGVPAPCQALINTVLAQDGLGLGVTVPFSDMIANYSNGSSVYHGVTVNVRKRFSHNYEFLASYTWSHTIDDSTDLQSLLEPQNNFRPDQERSSSSFDQRNRLVLSGVYMSGKLSGDNVWKKIFSYWTVAPLIELSAGRPFNILVGSDRNFDFSPNTDRPLSVAPGTVNACGDTAVNSRFSFSGALIPACFIDGVFDGVASAPLNGNLGRNAGVRPFTAFTDFRVARTFHFGERFSLDGIMDMFNLVNKFNVADVNILYQTAGQPTSAFDARQFQFALKFHF